MASINDEGYVCAVAEIFEGHTVKKDSITYWVHQV